MVEVVTEAELPNAWSNVLAPSVAAAAAGGLAGKPGQRKGAHLLVQDGPDVVAWARD